MSMPTSDANRRTVLIIALLALGACSQPVSNVPKGETIACAIDGATQFADVCTAERNGNRIVIHRPDGGFRQFEVTGEGTVRALDGADSAQAIAVANGTVEAQIDGDRYRFRLEATGNAAKP